MLADVSAEFSTRPHNEYKESWQSGRMRRS
jgi:hypothetical protein